MPSFQTQEAAENGADCAVWNQQHRKERRRFTVESRVQGRISPPDCAGHATSPWRRSETRSTCLPYGRIHGRIPCLMQHGQRTGLIYRTALLLLQSIDLTVCDLNSSKLDNVGPRCQEEAAQRSKKGSAEAGKSRKGSAKAAQRQRKGSGKVKGRQRMSCRRPAGPDAPPAPPARGPLGRVARGEPIDCPQC